MDSGELTEEHNKPLPDDGVGHALRRTRMRMKSNVAGEILQVQGGHIVRSTGRKDRHSKVFTVNGTRDRRVRLSAHTAIQFYDVQDRLGYDRPSKAVDWLIKKAKSAIDKLSESDVPSAVANTDSIGQETDIAGERSALSGCDNFRLAENLIPLPLDSAVNFQSYQNLGLSLQTLQDATVLFPAKSSPENDQTAVYDGGSGLGFENGYERMVGWNSVFGLQPFLNPSSGALHEQPASMSSARIIAGALPEFDVAGRFEGEEHESEVVLVNTSSRSSPYSGR